MERLIEVLIVEDDLRIAEIHKRFLEKVQGFSVIGIAITKQEATDYVSIFKPPLILLDVYLPDMSGVEFLSYIKQNSPHSNVIMITASKEGPTISKALELGVFDYIVKPFLFHRFQETLLTFQSFYSKLQNIQKAEIQLSQTDVDEILNKKDNQSSIVDSSLPKGIDKLTLEKINALMLESTKGYNAEEVGLQCGVSRTTARRYLEYLVSNGALQADLLYGMVGRPERVYIKQ